MTEGALILTTGGVLSNDTNAVVEVVHIEIVFVTANEQVPEALTLIVGVDAPLVIPGPVQL